MRPCLATVRRDSVVASSGLGDGPDDGV
jgi:hypothetical protein